MPYESKELGMLAAIAKANPEMTPDNALALFLSKVRGTRISEVPYRLVLDASGPRGAGKGAPMEVLYGKDAIATRPLNIVTPPLPVTYAELPGYAPRFRQWVCWLAAVLNRDTLKYGSDIVYYKEDGVEIHPRTVPSGLELKLNIYMLIPLNKWRQ